MSAVATAAARPWQESSLLDFEGSPTTRFLRVIESIPARTRFTVNDVRDRLDAAEVPNARRGGLMHAAKVAGLIEPVTVAAWGQDYEVRARSTGTTAHRATVRVYRRLGEHDDDQGSPAGGRS